MKHTFSTVITKDKSRDSAVRRVLLITLVLNLAISIIKVLYGYYTNSVAIVSDGYHSLFDSFSNVIGLVGLHHASHPPDESHPYGHRKYETVFTIFIGVLMFLACLEIFKNVYEALTGAHHVIITTQSFIIMAATTSVNIFVTLYEKRMGRRYSSEYLMADAEHTRSDIYASLGVIAGLGLMKFGVPNADAIVGGFVGLLVAKAGLDIIREATEILVDSTQADHGAIKETAIAVKGVSECHEIRTRGSRGNVFVDLHVLVKPAMTVGEAHAIADRVEEDIKRRLPEVVDVVVHIEPEE